MKSTFLTILLYVFAALNGACQLNSESQFKEFSRVEKGTDVTPEKLKDFRLSSINPSSKLHSKVEAFRTYYRWGRDIEMPHLDAAITSPSRAEFELLKMTYGFGLSRVKFKANERYDLKDFLTPFMQAVHHTFFEREISKNQDILASNCWTTAYEFIRTANKDSSSFQVFYADSAYVRKHFENQSNSEIVGEMSGLDAFPYKKMIFGDVVLFFDADNVLYHAAVFVDKAIFFEKVAVINIAPYRLVLESDFHYKPKKEDRIVIRRFHNRRLPHPSVVMHTSRQEFDKQQKKILNRRVELFTRETKIIQDDDGRSVLHPESFKALFRKI